MLAWLRASDLHPTAAEIHAGVLPECPALSLGTVYRNLEILVVDGLVDEVPSGAGAARYDGNVEPHHHFICEACASILDLDVAVPRGIGKRLADEHGLRANRLQMTFFGRCPDCDDSGASASP